MSLKDPIDCKVSKLYEGDVSANSPVSECLMSKIGANINGIKSAWKFECKSFTGSGSMTTGNQIFGMFIVAHSMTSTFNLNQFNGEVISLGGQNGFTYIDGLAPNTSYSFTSSGTLTLICISC